MKTLKRQSAFLSQLAAKTVPKGLHCLSQRLTVEHSTRAPLQRSPQPDRSRLEVRLALNGLIWFCLFRSLAETAANSVVLEVRSALDAPVACCVVLLVESCQYFCHTGLQVPTMDGLPSVLRIVSTLHRW